ncbi:MAG: HU family DNA-binding protein [Alphaproteobacteria bacterium]|jgi:DNA-binding protein HU-beta|nr:HU family DNA-binding protein [Alphaproteobacteria bacterium]MDE0409908.1 HU family DNA-binding protein [Alphaproteobacteria bacterium]
MNKNDLVGAVAVSANLQRAEAARAVEAVFDTISKALADGQDVRLIGFGTFSVAHRPASKARNPRTGETIDVAPSNQPKFRAGKGLKDAVN